MTIIKDTDDSPAYLYLKPIAAAQCFLVFELPLKHVVGTKQFQMKQETT